MQKIDREHTHCTIIVYSCCTMGEDERFEQTFQLIIAHNVAFSSSSPTHGGDGGCPHPLCLTLHFSLAPFPFAANSYERVNESMKIACCSIHSHTHTHKKPCNAHLSQEMSFELVTHLNNVWTKNETDERRNTSPSFRIH